MIVEVVMYPDDTISDAQMLLSAYRHFDVQTETCFPIQEIWYL